MNALTYTLNLRQPLLIGQVGAGEENSAITFNHIAGSTIRGALIGRYMAQNGDELNPANEEVRQLFFNGTVTFLNAYLADHVGKRSLPVPRSWMIEKNDTDNESGTITDNAFVSVAHIREPKVVSAPFCNATFTEFDGGAAKASGRATILYAPKHHTGLHNASTRRYIKQENDSVVFRYEAVAADQSFCGAILSNDNLLLDKLEALLEAPDLFLGRSRSAGYGHTEIVALARVEDWQEYMAVTPKQPVDGITLTLLSDTILRNGYGQYTSDLATVAAIADLGIKPKRSFLRADLTGGFNRKWGLPLPQIPVVAAGSVWVFPKSQAIEDALQKLVATGIGERRIEGFGRVAVNWQQFPYLEKRPPNRERQYTSTIALNGQVKRLAKEMVQRLYRQQLDQKLLSVLDDNLTISGIVPENTQLSRLRIIVRHAWRDRDRQVVQTFLRKMKPLARNQYLQARVGTKSLLQWLEEGWQDDKLWRDYFYISTTNLPQLGGVQATEDDALKLEYMARLIDTLCNQAIKRRQSEEASVLAREVA